MAVEVVASGRVRVAGASADKVSRLVSDGDSISLAGPARRFASRGGDKLEGALERFAVDVAGARAVDAGASTGGFTDCLLQRGAASVHAIDVGRAQLAWALRTDARVVLHEETNLRTVSLETLGGLPFDVTVADLSFISLVLVGPVLRDITAPGKPMVLLVKPQFEAGRERVGRGGVVRDRSVHLDTLDAVVEGLAGHGVVVESLMPSPIRGASGNIEFLALARHDGPNAIISRAGLEAVVEEAHGEALATGGAS